MLNLNCTILAAVVEQALADAADHPRWVNAIRRAFEEVDSNPYLERAEHGGLLIGSPSGSVYSSNGICQCEAFAYGRPCWHRAAARLVRRHDEREAAAQRPTMPALGQRISAARALAEMNELFN